jgi:osmotically-inducible protein OsmY
MNVATTGAQAVYHHHSIEKNVNDQYISMRAYQTLHFKTDEFNNANISIATYNGEVLLAGQTPTVWQRQKAEHLVRAIPDVKAVYNLIKIASPSSTLTRVSDAWITSKVKAKLIASEDVDATQIKVVTENGTVYLMGVVSPTHAAAAVELARQTDGVESVVRIFSYITISKHLA